MTNGTRPSAAGASAAGPPSPRRRQPLVIEDVLCPTPKAGEPLVTKDLRVG